MVTHLAYQFGVVARSCRGKRHGIEPGEHIDIEETVIEGRHQRICDRMGKTHEIAVVRRGVDHQEVVAMLAAADMAKASDPISKATYFIALTI